MFIKLQDIYNLFISAFHKYLEFKSKLQVNIKKSYENESNIFECPACPQVYLFNNYYLIFIKYTKCNNVLLLIIFLAK